ncbi:bifunctional tetrahydrofolate synthase/dihydrofolate synthase [Legionella hackeliae]|uniref:Dihydrofolate synthase/folylpolyglutamate synthase n=1 Tax=Legionella hackeliae TaxID=449 RepID=A0A0A8UQ34_LEGHA|nr:bifunctional tetrahydrofolate synthase/dihydrofolate synthase [Legionella hackeliae]KTD09799.1 dihydrofolate:folylpolyglutamate synthetase FolC [Legionella hackeliae]CEK10873.1 Bifunctional protein folC [Includes: Folylpolyglutamate synthase; Dihydrofolate synthase] [Legionella hackeliae]STX47610.1 dihydrofolate:folylpolyglutamate synthetase FolC [Legionella hackeliae]
MKQYRNFTVAQWLHYLENRHQQEIQLGLNRIYKVAESLFLLKPQAKVISVAGTNGKGSTVAALEAIYKNAGYQVASYTSPHVVSFNERIKINQQPISDEALAEAFCVIEEGRGSTFLTYFEMATLAALWYFKKHSIDVLILEVGLGGRLDATNIVDADLAVITTIDLDHQEFLGNNKESIGYEKAGILRYGKPVIYADSNPPKSITAAVSSLNCPLYRLGDNYNYELDDTVLKFVFGEHIIELPRPVLHANSIAAAVMASFCLQAALPVTAVQIVESLKGLLLPGRLHFINGRVMTLLDVSHNPQAVNYLAKHIENLRWPGAIHAVFSALKDKDIPALIEPLTKLVDYWYPALLTGKRAASEEQFSAAFHIYGIVPFSYADPLLAYEAACNVASTGDLIVVYGSFVTVGQVLPAVCNTNTTRTEEI